MKMLFSGFLVAFVTIAPASFGQGADISGPARVIDGDTLEIGGTIIRLEGIDAPEIRQECQNASGKSYKCGRSAKEALRRLARDAVTCTPSGKDRNGQTLAYCRVGSIDLNRQMVVDGWAFAFVKYNRGRVTPAG